MSRKLFAISSWVGLIGLLAIILLGFYWMVIEGNPPIEVAQPVQIEPEVAIPGQTVYMMTEFCKNTDSPSRLTSYWQKSGGEIFGIRVQDISISNRGCRKLTIPITIPESMSPGMWKRVNIGEYEVNFLKTRSAQWESEYIKVEEILE